jgi:hypothetical protein
VAGYTANTVGLTWACLLTGHVLGGSALVCTVVVYCSHIRYQEALLAESGGEKGGREGRRSDDGCGDSHPLSSSTANDQQPLLADAPTSA